MRYLDHVFEELKARSRSRTMTLKSTNVCWRVVVMLVPTSLKMDSNPLFCSYVWINVRKPFPDFLCD